MPVQRLRIVETMPYITSVSVEVQNCRCLSYNSQGLLYEVADDPAPVLRREAHVLIRETEGARSLDEHASTLRLFRVEEQGVLVVVEPTNHRDDEQNEDDDPAVHPVDENKDEDRCAADPPEFPEEESEEATE